MFGKITQPVFLYFAQHFHRAECIQRLKIIKKQHIHIHQATLLHPSSLRTRHFTIPASCLPEFTAINPLAASNG